MKMDREQLKMDREQLRRLVLRAKTLEEVIEAREQLRAWLKLHPDDYQLLGEGESLVMLEEALRSTKRSRRD